jgi:hypothetical protein
MSEARGQTYTVLYQKLDMKKMKMMSIRWLSLEKERQEISTKLYVLRIRLIGFWSRMMKLKTDGDNTSTNYSIKRVSKLRLSWMTHLITLIGNSFGEFKS